MATTDWAGWLAAVLTFSTFACRNMARLRMLAVLANVAFIAYSASASLWPVLALHLALLPVNVLRLVEQRREVTSSLNREAPVSLGANHSN